MAINSQILSKEQVLIVGCGDLGRRLAQFLPQNAYSVTGLRRRPAENLPFLRYQLCDAQDRAALGKHLQDDYPVIIITMTPGERSDTGYQNAYVHSCENLVTELRRRSCRPRLVIFVSSSAVYGQQDGSWVDENSPTQPEGFSGKRLLEAERIILESGLPGCVVRFSGIYGPGRTRLIEQVRQNKASASRAYTNRIHAEDCAGALAHLIQVSRTQPLAPVYLASDGTPTPMVEVVSWLAERMGVTDFLADDAQNERGNKRCSNSLLLETGFHFRYPGFRDGYAELLAGQGQ